ncbi:MAG: hypothetical protein S4CHLAM102_16210 [Chlamydiia bacterium]|nr:hypothetical protein [Chlamydiia bacterium]
MTHEPIIHDTLPSIPLPEDKETINILDITGGGTRATMPVALLNEMETKCGRPLDEMFDLAIGTSAGYAAQALLFGKHQNKRIASPLEAIEIIESIALKIGKSSPSFRFFKTPISFKSTVFCSKKKREILSEIIPPQLTTKDTLIPIYASVYDWGREAMQIVGANHPYYLLDAIDATTALPLLYAPSQIQSVNQQEQIMGLDPGVHEADPFTLVLTSILNLKNPNTKVNILRLGCGGCVPKTPKTWNYTAWTTYLFSKIRYSYYKGAYGKFQDDPAVTEKLSQHLNHITITSIDTCDYIRAGLEPSMRNHKYMQKKRDEYLERNRPALNEFLEKTGLLK